MCDYASEECFLRWNLRWPKFLWAAFLFYGKVWESLWESKSISNQVWKEKNVTVLSSLNYRKDFAIIDVHQEEVVCALARIITYSSKLVTPIDQGWKFYGNFYFSIFTHFQIRPLQESGHIISDYEIGLFLKVFQGFFIK